MNYTIVINSFVWFGCMAYYFLFARRWYIGPKMTVDESASTASDNIIVASVPHAFPIDEPESFDHKKK